VGAEAEGLRPVGGHRGETSSRLSLASLKLTSGMLLASSSILDERVERSGLV
jgi:hypothetical protein